MEKLKPEYKLRGTGFHPMPIAIQIERTQNAAIYERNDPDGSKYYETFKVRVTPERVFPNGDILPMHEQYPSNNSFGDWAWCITNKNRAFRKYNEIK